MLVPGFAYRIGVVVKELIGELKTITADAGA
jgi:hypothetical protein